ACLTEQHVSAALPVATLTIFTGPEASCLNSFLQREIATGRLLSASSWRENNALPYKALAQPWIAPHVVNAFGVNGTRRSFEDLNMLNRSPNPRLQRTRSALSGAPARLHRIARRRSSPSNPQQGSCGGWPRGSRSSRMYSLRKADFWCR